MKSLWLRLFTLVAFSLLAVASVAQPRHNSAWTARLLQDDVRAGESTQIVFEGTIEPDWYIYGPQIEGYWIVTKGNIADDSAAPVTRNGDDVWPIGEMYKTADELGNLDAAPVVIYKNQVAFGVPIKIDEGASGEHTITVSIQAQACSTVNGLCDPGMPTTIEIPLSIQPGEPRPDRMAPVAEAPPQPSGYETPAEDAQATPERVAAALNGDTTPAGDGSGDGTGAGTTTDETTTQIQEAQEAGIVPFFILSLSAGLLALLTPCVWPMIPVTVSYFSKQSGDNKAKSVSQALAYSLGIIGTFVGLGLIATLIFGASGAQSFAANVWVNLFLGLLFVALALNLFGYYEIMIPSGFVNKVQGKAKGGGFIAPVLLGFVFSLTTFTCTVPFVGTILFSATQGDYLYPIIGMLGFSLAFAIPFFFLALAPGAVSRLPKSGTWLNIVKATLGFVELAAGLKFLSNAELTFNAQFLTYPVYMTIWVVIFAAAALFLFGIIKLPNNEGTEAGPGRKFAGTVMVGFCVYLLFAINRPSLLGSGIAFTPPIPYPGTSNTAESGLAWQHTYDEAIAMAKEQNKPVFLNFTGVTCANCRVMERRFHSDEKYVEALRPFVLAELYTDRNTEEDNAHAKLREDLAKTSSNPAYVIVTPEGEVVSMYLGAALSDDANKKFLDFLSKGYNSASGSAVAQR